MNPVLLGVVRIYPTSGPVPGKPNCKKIGRESVNPRVGNSALLA